MPAVTRSRMIACQYWLEETHGQTEEWHPLGDRLPMLRERR